MSMSLPSRGECSVCPHQRAMKVIVRFAIVDAVLIVFFCSLGLIAGERPKPQTHTVTIEGMKFHPEALTVALGDTVVWINKDLVDRRMASQETKNA